MIPNLPDHNVVVRLSALGDVVLTTGVLRYWYERHGWTFTVITRQAFAPVFDGHPAVRAVRILPENALRGRALLTYCRALSAEFAGCGLIDLHGTGRSRLLAWLWKGPVVRYAKHGLARRLFLMSGGRMGRETLLRHTVPQRYALAVEPEAPPREALPPQLFLSSVELTAGEGLAARARGRGGLEMPLVALHPYAAHRGKTWSPERWRELMIALDAQGLAWCVIGRAGEADRIPNLPVTRDFTNQCGIRESAALLAACTALITGDSGPMHLAAAVGVPVIALFGCTTKEWGFYPCGPRDAVLEVEMSCRPCTLHGAETCPRAYACLDGITTNDVLAALGTLGAHTP